MGKRLRNFLTVFVAALGLVVLVFASHPTESQAATYNTNDLLTGIHIADKNYGTASDVQLTLDWDASGHDLANGDVWTIDLPNTLKVNKDGETFPLLDNSGNTIGTVVLHADNTVTVEFTDVEGKKDFSGNININSGIGVGKGAIVGDNNVVIGDYNDNMTVTTSDSDFSKKGVIGTDENGDAIVTWTILVNRNSADFKNLKVIENAINDDQTFIPSSVNVYEASWSRPGYYNKGRLLDSSEYTLTDSGNGFELDLPKSNQFYAVTFQTKINDPDNASNGHKFRNHADFLWSNGGSGNNSSNGQGSADGSVSGNANSGNGNGNNILGSVTLTKKDADDEAVLAGATYDLYQEGSDTPIKTGLTTDANGQITVTDLAKGNYYFKETKAPNGYQANGNEIPFTISGSTTTPVNVETKDEKEGSKEGSIVIMKIDAETGYRLAGAEFEVRDANNKVVGTITTDSLGIGHLYNLPIGTYTLHEKTAPDGYIAGGDIKFEITEDNLTPSLISVENEKNTGIDDVYSVTLQKFDRDDMVTGVPGAEYTLYDADGNALSVHTTDELGVIIVNGLTPGNYYFQESKAPAGYDINPDKIHFEIKDEAANEIGLGTLETSDPKTTTGEPGTGEPGTGEPGTSEPGTSEPGTSEPGTSEPGTSEPGTGEPDTDGNGGVIVDPENPTGNNNNNGNQTGIITNPGSNSNNNSSNSNNSSNKLPQTGAKSGLVASILGLFLLFGLAINKRRAN